VFSFIQKCEKIMSEPKEIGDILREIKLLPEHADLAEKPDSRPQECAFCHQTFTSHPQWLGSGWKYPYVCDDCSEHGPWAKVLHDRKFWSDIEPAPERLFVCRGCGHEQRVRPRFKAGLWQYDFKCLRCGEESIALRRLRTICETCRKPMFMNEDMPVKRCRACLKKRQAGQDRFVGDGNVEFDEDL
jgi:ribosomal protein L37AE/L43A